MCHLVFGKVFVKNTNKGSFLFVSIIINYCKEMGNLGGGFLKSLKHYTMKIPLLLIYTKKITQVLVFLRVLTIAHIVQLVPYGLQLQLGKETV